MATVVKSPIPYAVQAALVEASGKVFWYWAPYKHFLRKSGVNAAAVERLAAEYNKYEVMRRLLAELDSAGNAGRRVQTQLVEGLVSHPLSEADGIDIEVARRTQAHLRAVAQEHGVLCQPEARCDTSSARELAARRRSAQQERLQARQRAQRREALCAEYCGLLQNGTDRQGRGYRLEEMLGEVAQLDGLRYRPPSRKGTVTQTDGMVGYDGFQYLVEARWRNEPADVAALATLAHKAGRNLQSTRGLFLSIVGFRDEVVREIETGTKNVLLMTGQEFLLVLEGRVTLERALQLKVDEGANRGHIFFDLARCVTL